MFDRSITNIVKECEEHLPQELYEALCERITQYAVAHISLDARRRTLQAQVDRIDQITGLN